MPQVANIVVSARAEAVGQVCVRVEDDTLDHDITWVIAASTAQEIARALNDAANESWILDEHPG